MINKSLSRSSTMFFFLRRWTPGLVFKTLVERPFIRNVASTVFAQVVAQLLNLLGSVIIARTLGPSGKGAALIVLLIGNLLALVLNCGISFSNVYFTASGKISPSKLLQNSVLFTILMTGLGVVLVTIVSATGLTQKLIPGISSGLLLAGVVVLPFLLLNAMLACLLQGLQQIITVNIINFLQALCNVVLIIILVVFFRFGIWGAVLATQVATVFAVGAKFFVLCGQGLEAWPKWDSPVVRETLNYGAKCYVANIMQFFNFRLDSLIVNVYLGASGTGLYSVSVALAELLWYLPNAAAYVLFPKSAEIEAHAMRKMLPKVLFTTVGITTGTAIVLAIGGRLIIGTLYSKAFLPAYGPLLALLPGVICLGAANVLLANLSGSGHPIYQSMSVGASLVFTISLDFALIPQYGIMGAAVASSISYFVGFLAAVYFYFHAKKRAIEVATA